MEMEQGKAWYLKPEPGTVGMIPVAARGVRESEHLRLSEAASRGDPRVSGPFLGFNPNALPIRLHPRNEVTCDSTQRAKIAWLPRPKESNAISHQKQVRQRRGL